MQLFLHGGSFGIVDPEFVYDIGFFVFDLPFYRAVLDWLFVAVCFAFVASLATHYLYRRPATDDGQGHADPGRAGSARGARRLIDPVEGGCVLVRPVRAVVG